MAKRVKNGERKLGLESLNAIVAICRFSGYVEIDWPYSVQYAWPSVCVGGEVHNGVLSIISPQIARGRKRSEQIERKKKKIAMPRDKTRQKMIKIQNIEM